MPAFAQDQELNKILSFENKQKNPIDAWGGGPPETIFFDSVTVNQGRGAARIERKENSQGNFSSIAKQLPIDFGGKTIELRGFLRTEDANGQVGLWLREDGSAGVVQFDNMAGRGPSGTTDWTEYSIKLPLDDKAKTLMFGALIAGQGTIWVDDLTLLVDGKPLSEAPERVVSLTIIDTDSTFNAGSNISINSVTEAQVTNLEKLGRVWGFLKYHHPRIAAGDFHWDFELFRVLPRLLTAPDAAQGNQLLSDWITKTVGVPASCNPCAKMSDQERVHLNPDLDWLEDTSLLGADLSQQLQTIYTNRFAGNDHFYISQVQGVGNPAFQNEPAYGGLSPLDTGYRLLTLFRFWTIIEYWSPYKDLLEDDWTAVLRNTIPAIVEAEDSDTFQLELLKLSALVYDTHTNIWQAVNVRPPRGECYWPFTTRFIENKAVIVGYTDEARATASGLLVGDVINTIDGDDVEDLVEAWSPYYAASNDITRLRDISRYLPRGACGSTELGIQRGNEQLTISAERFDDLSFQPPKHDRKGETFQHLSPEVSYLKLSSVSNGDIDHYIEESAGKEGLVIDIRNYPAQFVVWTLGSRLIQEPHEFVRFTIGDLQNPGTFLWNAPLTMQPKSPGYEGRIAILIDEVSLSQSEYTTMGFRVSPRAKVVGSTTAAADGNVSPFPLPGGLRSTITGIGVFYPDKSPTQRIGIIPDIVATPTIKGVRAGRDEVLEAALRYLLPDANEDEIVQMAMRP